MEDRKNVGFVNFENVMEQMMRAHIFRIADKRAMLSSSNRSNDPNLIMDLRHKKIGEVLPVTLKKDAVLAEATRLVMDEENEILYRRREKELLETELRKFEKVLSNSRPKFGGPYTCGKRKILDNIEDYGGLWKMAPRRIKVSVKDSPKIVHFQSEQRNVDDTSVETIKVTIKDKPSIEREERDVESMRKIFDVLVNYAKEERRLRELRLKIQENLANRRMRKYFEAWKIRMESSKQRALKRKEEAEISDERKIEIFVNAINEKQRKLAKKPAERKSSIPRNPETREAEKTGSRRTEEVRNAPRNRAVHVVEPPALNRLNAQKKIIAEQKIKLAEQNKIIEELRLKKIQDDARNSGRETISVAREVLAHCGQRARRTLLQLMREEGCRDKTLLEPPRTTSPPRFLARMEARAEARRERVRIAEEHRKRKLEEQKLKEEAARREEEENRKRLQLEARREAKRIREEQDRKRVRDMERSKLANEMAEKFYRKYLMRRYIIEPLASLVELKHNCVKKALEHYERKLLKKSLGSLKIETAEQRNRKLEMSISVWRKNILWYTFKSWLEATRREGKKAQVAMDFYEFRLQEKCLKFWCDEAAAAKIRATENGELANRHFENTLKHKYFHKWRGYLNISEDVRESERRKEIWRELVQRVVPDFDPKQRGVIIDD